MKSMIVGFLMLAPLAAIAGPVEETGEATTAALAKFAAEERAHLEHFTGVKAWPQGGGFAVKVYLHGSDTVNYSCIKHEMGGELMMMCNKN